MSVANAVRDPYRILIVAAAVFFANGTGPMIPAGLFDAYDLIVQHVGHGTSALYAVKRVQTDMSAQPPVSSLH